ncbi:MAG: hypothetical protein E4H47_02130 [Parcubacteria group bacterium]|nr:MAG: hypothetical protein E4H47_02130 [Parcubacteria group bacterium]
MNSFTKISGWLLLFSGLLIIVLTIWYSYSIFYSKVAIPDFFQNPEVVKNASSPAENQEMQVLLQKAIQDYLKEVLPLDLITKPLNFVVWLILALILMSGGSRISDLGIKLIKIGQEKNEHA